jgi:hypothetical protein
MGQAFKCALTGKLHEGEGKSQLLVKVNKTFALLCYPQEIIDPQHTVNAAISEAAEVAITMALQKLDKK